MPRIARDIGKTGWAHVIVRGINRESLFYDEDDYKRFKTTIERYQKEIVFEIAAYCMMSNHVHLLLYVEDGSYAALLKKLLVSYAAYYNKKYSRVGPVFQDRFRSEPIDDERYLLTVARYIYRNPQKAGICLAKNYPYTFIQRDGILSGYFDTNEELTAFLETENCDICLEFESTDEHADTKALELIKTITKETNPQAIQSLEKNQRDQILVKLKEQGLSVRQISRLTGVNRNIVQRA
ncbi:MAG: transposase [Coriobacteriales bacterium]|nr:transposase [Coriobacteriales bacterium]